VMQLTDRVDWKYYACFKNSKCKHKLRVNPEHCAKHSRSKDCLCSAIKITQ